MRNESFVIQNNWLYFVPEANEANNSCANILDGPKIISAVDQFEDFSPLKPQNTNPKTPMLGTVWRSKILVADCYVGAQGRGQITEQFL